MKMLTTLVVASLASTGLSADFSQVELFGRCYEQLTSERASAKVSLLADVRSGNKTAAAACMEILRAAQLAGTGEVDQGIGASIVTHLHHVHSDWFIGRDIPIQDGSTHRRLVQETWEPSTPAAYLTRAMFDPAATPESIFLGDRPSIHRETMAPTTSFTNFNVIGRQISKADTVYDAFNFAPRGVITGFHEDNEVLSSFDFISRSLTRVNGTTNLRPNFGKGYIGDLIYIYIADPDFKISDGATNMRRKWARNFFEDAMCRSLPVVRVADVVDWVTDDENAAPFRNAATCTVCHASMDQAAAVIRNIELKAFNQKFDPYEEISGAWTDSDIPGVNGSKVRASASNGAKTRWKSMHLKDLYYKVEMHFPAADSLATKIKRTVQHAGGLFQDEVDPNTLSGWKKLGDFRFRNTPTGGTPEHVAIQKAQDGTAKIAADAVRYTPFENRLHGTSAASGYAETGTWADGGNLTTVYEAGVKVRQSQAANAAATWTLNDVPVDNYFVQFYALKTNAGGVGRLTITVNGQAHETMDIDFKNIAASAWIDLKDLNLTAAGGDVKVQLTRSSAAGYIYSHAFRLVSKTKLVASRQVFVDNDGNQIKFPMVHFNSYLDGRTPLEPEGDWPAVAVANYHLRPANGVLYYRDYKGELVNTPVEGLDDFAEKVAGRADPYICLAKRYYKYFTGIDVEISDPVGKNYSGEYQVHRKFVIDAGVLLHTRRAENGAIMKLVESILKSPGYVQRKVSP